MPIKQALIAIVVLAGLSGCNAGSPTAESIDGEVTRITGAIQYGRVTVSLIDDRSIRQVAAADTDAAGNFALTLPQDVSGTLLLEVKPAADGRSRMICDSAGGCGDYARGEGMPVPASFRMLSLVSPAELDGRRLSINPYTHIATHEAIGITGLLSERSITDARSRIARGYGVSDGFWRHGQPRNGAREQLQGVAMASVESPGHRLVLRDGALRVDSGASVTVAESCHQGAGCDIAGYAVGNDQASRTQLF